jgi:hypothetical protein
VFFSWAHFAPSSHDKIVDNILLAAPVFGPAVKVLVLIASCVVVSQMNRNLSNPQSSRFKNRKRKTWLNFGFLVVVSTVFGIEIAAFVNRVKTQSYRFMVVLDIIKCYSVALLFAIDFEVNNGADIASI